MASAKQDFERFVVWLHQHDEMAPPDVRRLTNLALANFDALAATSRHRSQRSVYLEGLLRPALAHTSDAPPAAPAATANGVWPWKRLRHLTLGPFRGFRTSEPFDLQKRIVLFYGPNGSGKTSFCEGLEYGLLGAVEEAENKRIDARTYLKNLHAGQFSAPVLKATDHQNREVDVISNPDTFRFCFIEKNRIDSFSRIAARPPGQRTELIATLFGMEQFNEFVSHFNESIDSQLILESKNKTVLTERRRALANDQAMVEAETQSLADLAAEEMELAHRYSAETSYIKLKQLIGSEGAPGRLHELNDILNSIPPAVIGLTSAALRTAFEEAHRWHEQAEKISDILEERSAQVSFKDLYTSVLALQESEGDHCPACDTPLEGPSHVVANPYEKARAGLEQLKDLGELQESLKSTKANMAVASRALRQQLADMGKFIASQLEMDTPLGRYLSGLEIEPSGSWWMNLYPIQAEGHPEGSGLTDLLSLADRIEKQDATSRLALQDRQMRIEERDRLIELQLLVHTQDQKRQQSLDNVAEAKARIAAFDEANAQLIDDVEKEGQDIARDQPIKVAYDLFLRKLREYREQLPGTLIAGLNESAMNLYNEFNRNDHDVDKLEQLHLPLTGDGKIEITFRGNPGVRVDALHVLSEGHVRCLGLAILLAKAKSIESPLVVFDDAINAIDHDHRGGIREAIFENDNFSDMQLIVTCHSNEFIKDIQQHLPQKQRGDCVVYLLRHHTGDYRPRVRNNVPTKNYIVKAREAKDNLENREALASARQALEMLSEKAWRWLGSYDLGLISLLLPGVGAEPSLRNLCEALARKLKDATTFNHESKAPLLAAYDTILGIPSNNLVWTYLNKGTHEEADRDDFDAEVVETVVQILETLDAINLRPKK